MTKISGRRARITQRDGDIFSQSPTAGDDPRRVRAHRSPDAFRVSARSSDDRGDDDDGLAELVPRFSLSSHGHFFGHHIEPMVSIDFERILRLFALSLAAFS
ncbi:unnamed protein product [Heligmosomoides polygyrus]|uniref:Uncharacterized protein n=1 Tax=Heligmosomoides polygyrus TaxID=6339 RepID=A0A183GRE8_HELPZ|nr:unnamed protein product [Heligmosomoides polygyrus]